MGAVTEHLRRYLDVHLEGCVAPGASVALTDRETALELIQHGWADVSAGTPVAPEHLFQIGSISKSFTAIALLREHEEGRLDLRAPVTEYLPWFEVRSSYEPITVHHLLTHTAGLVTGMDFTGEGVHEVWALREMEAGWAPGTRYLYSNAGYKALGLVLEAVAGKPWWELVRTRVLEPLGMRDTVPIIAHDVRRRSAVGYAPFYDDRPWQVSHGVVPSTWFESATADGTICSTAADMAAYLRMLLNGGRGPDGPILKEESFALLTQRAVAANDEKEPAWYGYGIVTRERHGHTQIGHSGGMIGFTALIVGDLDSGFGAVMLLNGGGERLEAGLHAIESLEAHAAGHPLPAIPERPDPARIENAADYVGTYRCAERTLTVTAGGERLTVDLDERSAVLERPDAGSRSDVFLVAHPELDRFVLGFGRENDVVVEASHGPDRFVNERYGGPTEFEHPPEWESYTGHYRSHNPWASNFRVVLRAGRLWLVATFAEEHGDGELVPLGEGEFRVVSEDGSPSLIRFDTVIDGKATRAIHDCAPFYRTFTP